MPPTILLVDSYDPTRRALADLLRLGGYSVVEARSGVDGLRAAREQPPSLVIVDLWPFFSASVQMMERLHRSGLTVGTPILVVTSPVTPHYQERALAAGCVGYLQKPCPPERVLAEVRRILAADLSTGALIANEAEEAEAVPYP